MKVQQRQDVKVSIYGFLTHIYDSGHKETSNLPGGHLPRHHHKSPRITWHRSERWSRQPAHRAWWTVASTVPSTFHLEDTTDKRHIVIPEKQKRDSSLRCTVNQLAIGRH